MSAEGQETHSSKWRENHGNILLGFVGLVLVVGAGLVIYRQNSAHSATSPPNVAPQSVPISADGQAPELGSEQGPSETDPSAETGDPEDTDDPATTGDPEDAGDPGESDAAGSLRSYDVV